MLPFVARPARPLRPSRTLSLLAGTCVALALGCAPEDDGPAARERPRPHQPRLLFEPPPIEPLPEPLEPSPLVGPFQSGISIAEAIELTGDLPFETTRNVRTPRRGACPGQHDLILQVTRFWDLERKGTLSLHFFDDRLTTARFKTFDEAGYRKAFFELHGLELTNRWKRAYIEPGSEIRNPVMGNEAMLIADSRLDQFASSVEKACRHQLQKERGWLDDAERDSTDDG